MADNTSTVLNQSREVLYGNQSEQITMDSVYQLLLNVDGRLSTIEQRVKQIDTVNESLVNLVSRLDGMKIKVDNVETSVNTLTAKKQETRGRHIESETE